MHAVVGRPSAEQRRRHERRDDEAVVAAVVGGRVAEDVVGEQPADLVAAEPPPRAVGLRDRRAEPVGVGIVGDRDGGRCSAARAMTRSIAPGSSGFGNDTVGNPGSGANCGSTTRRRQAGAAANAAANELAADAVHRRVGDDTAVAGAGAPCASKAT